MTTTTNRRSSDAPTTSDVNHMKMRINSLEKEVSDYKRRLDELRKAKNQTILKQEKQYLQVSNPIAERNQQYEKTIKTLEEKLSAQRTEFEKELQSLRENHRHQLSTLKTQHEEHLAELSTSADVTAAAKEYVVENHCIDHIERIEVLEFDNNTLKEEIESLLLQMSLKEATWCEREEILKKKIETNWQTKYAEWMQQMERKISELQETNNMLRVMLERHRPNDP